MAIAKWMRKQGVPVDWNFVRTFAGSPYPTPQTTPLAYAELTKTSTQGRTLRTSMVSSFGGVSMDPKLVLSQQAEAGQLQNNLAKAWSSAQKQGKTSFRFESNNKEYNAVALPTTGQRELGSYSTGGNDMADCLGIPVGMQGLPGLSRHYDSLHNEPTEFGFSWSLKLPRLEFEAVSEKGKLEYTSIEGDPATRALVQRFVLTDQFGTIHERFAKYFVDQGLNRIGFATERPSSGFRGLYPEGEGHYRLFFTNGNQAVFDSRGRLRALFISESKALYDYDGYDRLVAIRYSEAGREVEVKFEFDIQGRITSAASNQGRVTYEYGGDGNLSSVKCGNHTVNYRYDDRRLLIEISIEGEIAVKNSYDETGRLVKQSGPQENQIEQTVETIDEGRIVVVKEGSRFIRRYYDSQFRLLKMDDDSGNIRKYSYDDTGRVVGIDMSLPTGGRTKMEGSPDQRHIAVTDPRGVRTEYKFNSNGQIAEMLVNNQPSAIYKYDAQDRISEIAYKDGAAEYYTYSADGQISQYRRVASGTGPQPDQVLDFSYDERGILSNINSPALGQIGLSDQPQAVTVTQGGAVLTYRYDDEGRISQVDSPEGSAVTYNYQPDGRLRTIEMTKGGHVGVIDFAQENSIISKNSAGAQMKYTFDSTGLLTSVQDPYGYQTSYSYDSANHLRLIERPDGQCLEYIYDRATGRLREERSRLCKK
ncbi:MAG: hypothetical protein L0229_24605 [Blastocatellia bacterium]|nr:hypothetical protein [Blastocatellia bacterium]